ncbi:UNVERIFIED_CONTAM: hypothetical protein FKN15_052736 [Acipenser sinensis]
MVNVLGDALAAGIIAHLCQKDFLPYSDKVHFIDLLYSRFWFRSMVKCPVLFCRDRFRTMVNVLGDALAAGIIAHLCQKDFLPYSDKDILIGKIQNLPASEIPLQARKDSVFEDLGDVATEKLAVYYNIAQV